MSIARTSAWLLLAPLFLVTVLAAFLAAACKDAGPKPVIDDASFGPRVLKPPPTDEVRAVPPHNIHRTGVGPYELSASFHTTLALLPNGPRVELFKAEGLFDYRLMRADNDSLVLGVGRRERLAFISVLDPDIARTESGVGVGAGLEELVGALGAVLGPEEAARDSRIVTFSALPNTRFIVEKQKVVAAVVTPAKPEERAGVPEGEARPAKDAPVPGKTVEAALAPTAPSICEASTLSERRVEILERAGLEKGKGLLVGCLLSDSGEAVIRNENTLYVVGSNGQELVSLGSIEVPGLSFAAILDTGGERPDLFTVAQQQSLQQRKVIVSRYKLGNNRIVPTWTKVAFALEATTASWIGAKIEAADFLVELRGMDGALEIGGLFLERDHGVLRNVVPVNTIEVPIGRTTVRKPRSPVGGSDAGPTPPSSVPAKPNRPTPRAN